MDRPGSSDTLIANRASMYLLLARLFRVEADDDLLNQMAQIDFSVEADQRDIAEGYHLLKSCLAHLSSGTLTDLAADYAGVFLGAGKVGNNAAYPYESVYTSPDRLIMQDARDQVLKKYREEGLDKVDTFNVPEDHLALELEFMAYLCEKTRVALSANENQVATEYLAKQKDFLGQHLLNWVPEFCADVQHLASTDFYKGVAKVTRGYLAMEQTIVAQLSDELDGKTFESSIAYN